MLPFLFSRRMDVGRPVDRVPVGQGDEVLVFVGRWGGRWVERADERAAGALRFGEGIVERKHPVFRAVSAKLLLVFALYDTERVGDVSEGLAGPRNVSGQVRCHSLSPVGK